MTGPDWTFGPLVRALALGLHAQNPSLVHPFALRSGGGSLDDSLAALLKRALPMGGAPVVIRAIDLGMDRAGTMAIHSVVARSSEPKQLAAKWQRLERYAMGELITVFDPDTGPDTLAWTVTDSGTDSKPSGLSLFIAGSLLALASRMGCQGLSFSADGVALYGAQGSRSAVPPHNAKRFEMRWERFQARNPNPVMVPRQGGSDPTGAVRRATALIAADPARSWALDDVGQTIRLSRRTLQRRLSTAELDFPGLVRSVRVHYATQLIRGGRSLSEVAFLCGFADAAHFSRTCRRVMGMPPSRYRDLNDRDSGALREIRASLVP